MTLRKTIIAASLALTCGVASADSFDYVIPAAGAGPAINGGTWRSDVTIHNAGHELLLVKLSFHDTTGALHSIDLPLPGRTTRTLPDIVTNDFGQTESTGAIVIDTDDTLRGKLSITSRTYAASDGGELGQDIPALTDGESAAAGDTAIINGPSNSFASRFNFGLFASEATSIEWRLLRRDGTIAKNLVTDYPAGTQTQHVSGVATLLGEIAQDDDVVHARILSGRAWLYGSIVNQQTGDPAYVPANRTRENIGVQFRGIDTNRDGVPDFVDANGDGVLDHSVRIVTGRFPNDFRILATDPEGSDLTFSIVSSDGDAYLRDALGFVSWLPHSGLRGSTGRLVARISDGIDAVDVTIPAIFY